MNYYYVKNGEKQGPATIEELKTAGITTDTMVWAEGMADWIAAGSIDELKAICTPPMPNCSTTVSTPPPVPGVSTPHSQCGATEGRPIKPDNCMIWAILATIFCCMPLGIVAIVKANSVDSRYIAGDYVGAEAAANSAKNWSIWSAISGVIFSIIYGAFVMIAGLSTI